jgi:hypothetical protein
VSLYHLIARRWASNSMELRLSSYLALSVSYPVQTSRHDSIAHLEGAGLDTYPRGRKTMPSSTGVSRVDKECSGVLRVSPIGDLEGT